jgi:elongation factor G
MLEAGMIGAVTKADAVRTGDTLAAPGVDVVLSPIRVPSPVMALALKPKTRADDDRLSDGLQKLLDADPTLKLVRDAETHETVLWGMGHVHLEVAVAELAERYGVHVDTRLPRVSYRETISGPGDARYRHKKQSGGSGQFAEVALRVAPLERGSGIEFRWAVVGGTIPTQFQSSCEKGVRAGLRRGRSASRWSTCASRSTTARTTRSTARTSPSRPPPPRPSRRPARPPSRCCWSRWRC